MKKARMERAEAWQCKYNRVANTLPQTNDSISFFAHTFDTHDRNSWWASHNRDAARGFIVGNKATGWLAGWLARLFQSSERQTAVADHYTEEVTAEVAFRET